MACRRLAGDHFRDQQQGSQRRNRQDVELAHFQFVYMYCITMLYQIRTVVAKRKLIILVLPLV